jgi:hypothetical protein
MGLILSYPAVSFDHGPKCHARHLNVSGE